MSNTEVREKVRMESRFLIFQLNEEAVPLFGQTKVDASAYPLLFPSVREEKIRKANRHSRQ